MFSKKPNETTRLPCFIGLPIPAAAACVVSLALFIASDFGTVLPVQVRVTLISLGLLFIGSLMISPWKFPGLKNLRFKVSSFLLVVTTGLVACLFFLGLVDHFTEVFFLVSWLYVLVAFPIFAITYQRKTKRL